VHLFCRPPLAFLDHTKNVYYHHYHYYLVFFTIVAAGRSIGRLVANSYKKGKPERESKKNTAHDALQKTRQFVW